MKVKDMCVLLVLAFGSFLTLRLYGQNSNAAGVEPKASPSFSLIVAQAHPKLPGMGDQWSMAAVNANPGKNGAMGLVFTPELSFRGAWTQAESDESEEEPVYRGIGLYVSVTAGLNYFGGGDIEKGSRGMFDQAAAFIESLGHTVANRKTKAFNSGYEVGAEAAYLFTPRLGIRLRYSRSVGSHKSEFRYAVGNLEYSTWAMPDLKAHSFLLGLHYFLPLHRLLTLSVSAGPEIHFAKYLYAFSMTTAPLLETIQHTATATRLGALGIVGLDIHLNNRVDLVLEALGRIAKISNLKGTETYYRWDNFISSETTVKGYLYYLSGEQHPRLAIFAAEPEAAKKAAFDFSGVGLSGGLRFRF